MTRSGYGCGYCSEEEAAEWFFAIADAIASPEGQAFLRELADAIDALPAKCLIEKVLIDERGDCCAVGAVFRLRGIDTKGMDNDAECVAERLGAPLPLIAEVFDQNDGYLHDTPEARWQRVRRWVDRRIRKDGGT